MYSFQNTKVHLQGVPNFHYRQILVHYPYNNHSIYVYYQTGGAISGGDMDEPSSEAEPSSSLDTVEEESTEDEAADDSSDGDSDAEEKE